MVKRYGTFSKHEVLRDVSLSVAAGECFGLAGPNGAGKTTLIKLLLGLAQPDKGEVRIFGQRPDDAEVRRRIGFVPESAELPPAASPRALVRRLVALRGLDKHTAVPHGLGQLERLGLSGLMDRHAGKLSKGEKQRTLLALALLPDPELLILDEPTDGLDPLGRALVRRVLQEEVARGRTVFLNSHLLSETERICTRVAILNKGRVVREEIIHEQRPSGASVVVLAAPLVAEIPGVRKLAAGNEVLVAHDDLTGLNQVLDRLRAHGALIDEIHRERQDLEASFEAAVSGVQQEPSARGPKPGEPEVSRGSLLRGTKAVARVTREIFADLVSRKIGWVALALALIFVGVFLWGLHYDLLGGAIAAARRFGEGYVQDEADLGRKAGGYVATFVYWMLVPGSVLLAGLFAPPLLDPRRSILILSQPVSRGDLAGGIFAAVCALVLAEYVFLVTLLFAGLRSLSLQVPARFLLVPLPILFSFAAIYAVQLGFTYLVRNGLAAAAVGIFVFSASSIVGVLDAARPGAALSWVSGVAPLLPRVRSLSEEAAHFGSGQAPLLPPFALSAVFVAALGLAALHAAQRSER